MFTQRLRGLINLHVVIAVGAALILMAVFEALLPFLPLSQLLPSINLVPYYLCVSLGLLFSSRLLQRLSPVYHRLTWADAAWLATRQTGIVVLLVFAFMFAFKDRGLSRLFMGSYLLLCWGFLVVLNFQLPRFLSRLLYENSRQVPTLYVGSLRSLGRLRNWMSAKEAVGMRAVGFLTYDERIEGGTEPPFLGDVSDLGERIDQVRASQVILLEIPRNAEEGQHLIRTCQDRGCRLLIHSNLSEIMKHPLATVTEDGHQFYTLQEEPLEDPLNRLMKRIFDVLVSLPVVVFLLPPLCALVWVMQRLQSPGPLFWSQDRTGHGQRPFRMFKFRSMHATVRSSENEARQATRDDPRIYAFGGFLRRTSLDEFPQFFNVLLGQMSIVGPRPHLPAHDSEFASRMGTYRTRFFVKPGITGLAQCNGYRGEISDPVLLQKRIGYDLEYIARWSIWLDVEITAKTARQLIFPPSTAY